MLNLSNREYCETVYGGSEIEQIAERLSHVDPQSPVQLLKSWRQETILHRLPHKVENLKNLPKRLSSFISMAIKELSN